MMLSKCCGAPVRVEGDETRYYVCDRCGKACDTVDARRLIVAARLDELSHAVTEGRDAVARALARFPYHGQEGKKFRYFCGICWRRIKEAEGDV